MKPELTHEQELDRFRQLMTGELDGELSAEERTEFERLLAGSPERRNEWNELQRLKGITMKLRFFEPPPEVWGRYWISVYNRLERRVAWILVSLGAMIVLGFAGYHLVEALVAESHTPWWLKAGALALMAGGVILFVSVLREKRFTRKTDIYQKEVER